jgi:MtrB/PioB family decaheme-associated outer membrane protein
MKRTIVKLTPIATAVSLALGAVPAFAQEFLEIDDLVNPRSTVSAGVGYVHDDNRWYGEYSGFVDYSEDGFKPIFDLDYVTRDQETGTWVRANADIGRRAALGAEYEKQGDFGIGLSYQRITRQDPLVPNTGLVGQSTGDQTFDGVPLRDIDLSTDRDDFRLDLNKEFANGFSGRAMFREMQRDGVRFWGNHSGFGGPLGGFAFIGEPIDQTTREMEAEVGYKGDGFTFAGGVYGTSFENKNKVVNVNTGDNSEMSLPLENSSYQLYLKGGSSFASNTHLNFKLAHTEAEQDESYFATPDLAGGTRRANLGAEVETTLAYIGLNSRPVDGVTVNANLRYEDREDNTPIEVYKSSGDGTNKPQSRESFNSKIEVGYALQQGFTILGGLGYDEIERSAPDDPDNRIVHYADNEETSYRLELRRGMSETLNGSFSYTFRDREADNVRNSEHTPNYAVLSTHMAELERDEYRLALDWMPVEPLAVQFIYQLTDDEYDPVEEYGLQEGETELVSIDASYKINDDWTLHGWYTRNELEITNRVINGANEWNGAQKITGDAVGLGLKGIVNWQHHVGADITYGRDESEYSIDDDAGSADDLPDVKYKYWQFNLWGNYVLDENSGIRADWIYTKYDNDDWAWDGWDYLGGTTVNLEDDEDVNFVGVSFYHKWR